MSKISDHRQQTFFGHKRRKNVVSSTSQLSCTCIDTILCPLFQVPLHGLSPLFLSYFLFISIVSRWIIHHLSISLSGSLYVHHHHHHHVTVIHLFISLYLQLSSQYIFVVLPMHSFCYPSLLLSKYSSRSFVVYLISVYDTKCWWIICLWSCCQWHDTGVGIIMG